MSSRSPSPDNRNGAGGGSAPLLAPLLAALLGIGAGVALAAPSAQTILNRVLATWKGTGSLSARFEQTQQFAGFDEPLQSKGTLRILRPRFFDLRFDPPNRQRQVCDGEWIWTYMEEQKQVFKSPLGRDATRGVDLLDWVTEGAVATASVADTVFAPGSLRLDLTPGPNISLRELWLWVRESDAGLLGYEVIDTEGNRTRMRIIDLRKDKGLKPDQFRFTPPPGTEVIEMGGTP
jgi:outer membrane lipoprotein carrier protein